MTFSTTVRRLALPIACAALLVAGCGGSGGGSSTTKAAAAPATTSAATATAPATSTTTASAPAPSPAKVKIDNFAYTPKTLTVAVGAKVTWKNDDSANHSVTGKGWDLGNLNHGQSRSHTFTKAGTYSYVCTYHPFMHAKIVVR